MNKNLREAIAVARNCGAVVLDTINSKGGHPKLLLQTPGGKEISVPFSRTPSDRSWANSFRQMVQRRIRAADGGN